MSCLRSLVFLAALFSSAALSAQDNRLPVPDRKEVLAERKSYAKEMDNEADLDKRVGLMMAAALHDRCPVVRRYALLDDASSLALKSESFDLGVKAVHQLALGYQVDRAKLTRDFVVSFMKGRRSPRWAARAAEELMNTAFLVWAEGDGKAAKKLLDDAESQIKKYKQGGLFRRMQVLDDYLGELVKIEARVAKAGDAADRLDLALLALLRNGDVVSACLELEKCSDEALKAISTAEAARPTKSDQILDLADLWWQAGESATGVQQAAYRARALKLALGTVGRVSSALQDRLAVYLARPQYRCFSDRLVLVGEDVNEEADDYALIQVDDFVANQAIDRKLGGWRERLPKFPELHFSPGKRYLARITTNEGEIIVELHPEAAPNHVSNFIYLSRLGFYDDLRIHRIVQGFMAQLGCPKGDGTGSPGYKFDGELATSLKHDRTGILSMANSGPGTDGCQFFVTFTATPHLDGLHTAFGRMLTGRQACDALERRGSREQDGRTSSKVMLEKIRILVL